MKAQTTRAIFGGCRSEGVRRGERDLSSSESNQCEAAQRDAALKALTCRTRTDRPSVRGSRMILNMISRNKGCMQDGKQAYGTAHL